jgi:VWFA-related protein
MAVGKLGIMLVALAIAAGDVFTALAQAPTFKVDVQVVNVFATVRERKGRIVNDLSKDEFILEEDGKPQQIQYFSRQTDLPLILGLLVDTSLSQRSLIEEERSASAQFFNQVLRSDRDLAFLIKFDVEAELLQDLTNSLDSLKKALNALKTPASFRPPLNRPNGSDWHATSLVQIWPGGGQQWPGGGRGRPGNGRQGGPGRGNGIGTVLYDSVFLASDEIFRKQEGRKAIILISDGVDQSSKLSVEDAIEATQRADTFIYSIRYYDPNVYDNGGGGTVFGRNKGNADKQGENTLKSLSSETGGRMFEVTKKMKLKDIYATVQEELRNQYCLGYAPPKTGVAAFRRIRLRTKNPNLEVVTRSGYYAKN